MNTWTLPLTALLLNGVAWAATPQDVVSEQDVDAVANSATTWEGLRDWLGSGTPSLKMRYRFESVEQETFADDAHASTLRTTLGYRLDPYRKFSGFLEFEDIQQIGNGGYNSGLNGTTTRPFVPDAEGSEVNQAYFTYHVDEKTHATVGRQAIVLDNARFIGDVAWRQNHQSFDAVSIHSDAIEGVDLTYAYLQNINRIFGDVSGAGDVGSASHIVNASHELKDLGKLSVYGYLLDLELDALSTTTIGARFSGKQPLGESNQWMYTVELAQQDDAADNPGTVDAGYLHGELGVALDGVTFQVGLEVLEGSASDGQFTAPLGTLHKFNGWADLFLATPTEGLEDLYFSASGSVNGINLKGVYHEFSADSSGGDYGSEINLLAGYKVAEGFSVGLKYADFDSEAVGFADTTKTWLWMAMSF